MRSEAFTGFLCALLLGCVIWMGFIGYQAMKEGNYSAAMLSFGVGAFDAFALGFNLRSLME